MPTVRFIIFQNFGRCLWIFIVLEGRSWFAKRVLLAIVLAFPETTKILPPVIRDFGTAFCIQIWKAFLAVLLLQSRQ